MPNHKSAVKRVKQNEKRRARNRHVISTMRTLVKKARGAIESTVEGAEGAVPAAIRALSRAADKGVIHRNQASRKIGRLVKAANAAQAAK